MQHLKKKIKFLKNELIIKNLLVFSELFETPKQIKAVAAVSVDMTTNPKYLEQNGFSTQTTDMVNVSKARALGQEYYTKDELAFKKQNKFVRFWRKFYVYTDPASEAYSFYHHNTDTVPSYTDL